MMTLRGFLIFLCAFTTVIVLGVLSGCSASPHDRAFRGPDHVAYCGMSRCDGKVNR